jgi:hemerythrin
MLTTWREEMATGNEDIDRQHKDLLNKVDDLLRAAKAQQGEEEIARLIWFLKRYVRKHFRDEERLQINSGYPGYQVHKIQHQEFFRDVQRFEARYANEGASTVMIVNSVQMMCNWLNNHFHQIDRAMVDYLRTNAARDGS